MKILLTGGCGFVGSNLAAAALERGEELAVLDNLSRTGSEENRGWLGGRGDFRFVRGDVRDRCEVDRIVADFRPDVVLHLAGQVAMTTSVEDPRADFETNALGTFNVLDAVRVHRPEAIVLYSSTNKVYGDLEELEYAEDETRYRCPAHPRGFDESVPFRPSTPYGSSKGAADTYMTDFHTTFGIRTVVFRHSSMYGGRQFPTYDQGWIGWFCMKALEAASGSSEEFTISGNGKQVRDVLHGDDVVDLYFAAIDRIDSAAGQVFNVGGGMEQSLSLLELLGLLEGLTDTPLRYRRLPPRRSDQKVFVADVRKAASVLGWRPRVEAKTGVARTLEWLRGEK